MGMTHNKLIPELVVLSLKETHSFYCNILDFSISYERPEDGFLFLEREGVQLMFEEFGLANRHFINGALEKPFGRGVNFQIEVSNIQDLYERCLSYKVEFHQDLEEAWYRQDALLLGNKQFVISDPDGYLLRFFQDIGKKPAN